MTGSPCSAPLSACVQTVHRCIAPGIGSSAHAFISIPLLHSSPPSFESCLLGASHSHLPPLQRQQQQQQQHIHTQPTHSFAHTLTHNNSSRRLLLLLPHRTTPSHRARSTPYVTPDSSPLTYFGHKASSGHTTNPFHIGPRISDPCRSDLSARTSPFNNLHIG